MALAAVQYFGNNLEDMNMSQQFIELLYHNDHNSYAYLNMKSSDKSMRQIPCKNKASILNAADLAKDVWISLNLFTSCNSRSAENCRELTGYYFDLDKHTGSDKQIQRAVDKTTALIQNLVHKKIIPMPTIITKTGRGLGIYYLFNNSLALTSNTANQQKLYSFLYSKLADIFDYYCNGDDLLEVDHCVINERTRIVRLPGSYNCAAGRFCSIYSLGTDYFGSVLYYDMSDFKDYVHKFDEITTLKESKKEAVKLPVISFTGCTSTFLFNRVSQMYKLQLNFNNACSNKRREYMCFIFYNSAKQIYTDAIDKLNDFNRNFVLPLNQIEIDHVIQSVDRNFTSTHQGFYKLSDQWIIQKLDLSQEELDCTMLGQSQRLLERASAKERTKNKRDLRDRKVLQLLSNELLTYDNISRLCDVSVSTIKRIAKAYDIKRYNLVSPDVSCDSTSNTTNDSNENISYTAIPDYHDSSDLFVLFKIYISSLILFLSQKVHFLSQSLCVVYVVLINSYIILAYMQILGVRGPP